MNPFNVDEEIAHKIYQLYNRDEQSLNEDVTTLTKWLQTQKHLPEIMDEKKIRNFLLLNKCSIEKAKQRIDMYYTLRSRVPDMYETSNPKCPKMQLMMKIGCWVPLPKLTQEMYRVLLFKIVNQELNENLEPVEIAGFCFNLYEIRLQEDIVFADIVIFDMNGIKVGYITKLTPSVLAKMFTLYEKIFSIPMKGLYLVNAPSFVGLVLGLLKNVMKPKLFERIFVCESTSILNEHFPKEMLPKDYGGEEQTTEEIFEFVKLKLSEYEDRFDELDKLRVDESLRPEPLKNDEILGFHGNFKKLNVD